MYNPDVSGCLVLLLQRAVKTFRLGPHPAPIIPVDIVSRAIVHSALGWGAALSSAPIAGSSSYISANNHQARVDASTSATEEAGELAVSSPDDESRVVREDSASGDGISGSPTATCFPREVGESKGRLSGEIGGRVCIDGRAGGQTEEAEGLLSVRMDDDDDAVHVDPALGSHSRAGGTVMPSVVLSQVSAEAATAAAWVPTTDGSHHYDPLAIDPAAPVRATDDVVIRNLAWATHPVSHNSRRLNRNGVVEDEDAAAATAEIPGSGASGSTAVDDCLGYGEEGGGNSGRMPSFREFSGLLYDYAVLRGLRPSAEAFAVRVALAMASSSTGQFSSPCHHDRVTDYGDGLAYGGNGQQSHAPLERGSRGFRGLHAFLDRSPAWALRCIAALTERLPHRGGGRGDGGRCRENRHYGAHVATDMATPNFADAYFAEPSTSTGSTKASRATFADGVIPSAAEGPTAAGDTAAVSHRKTNPGIPRYKETKGFGRSSAAVAAAAKGEGAGETRAEDEEGRLSTGEQGSPGNWHPSESYSDTYSSSATGDGEEEKSEFPGVRGGVSAMVPLRPWRKRRSGLQAAVERMDRLVTLPAVYEPFTCRPYFFESALRVPRSLSTAGYALETAIASELLQRGL